MNLKKPFLFFVTTFFVVTPFFFCVADVLTTDCATDDICQAIVKIKNYVLMLGAVVVGMMIIIGGFLYATAGGNEKQVDTAKKTITYAVIGMIVMLAAEIITNSVKKLLGFT